MRFLIAFAASVCCVNAMIQGFLNEHGGVVSRSQLLTGVSPAALEHALQAGHVVALHRGVYVSADEVADREKQLRAALCYAGDGAALSHMTALDRQQLPVPPGPIHLLTHRDLRPEPGIGLVVHRRAGFRCEPPFVVVRGGLPLVQLEDALVDSWRLLAADERRAPVILAVQRRLTTAQRLLSSVGAAQNLPGRAELLHLVDLLGGGCHSELEIWGYLEIFQHPGLAHAVRQLPLRVGSSLVYLDLAFEEEKVAVELDGRLYHSSPQQHEWDLRRDSALAALGWVTVRLTHPRLRCRDAVILELLQLLAMRRHQLRIA